MSVLVKLLLFISAIFWIGQLIWRWQNDDLLVTALDMESSLSEVQLDILDG